MELKNIKESLDLAREKVVLLDHTLKKKEAIESELKSLEVKELELFKILEKENRDVEKIKGLSFASFLGSLTGTLDDKIEKEEIEALQAKNNYDRICHAKNEYKEKLLQLSDKLRSLNEARTEYENLLQLKRKYIYENSPSALNTIHQAESNIESCMYQIKEVQEAERAAYDLYEFSSVILQTLGSAKNWGLYDMVGGGMIATAIKRDKMATARDQINTLNHKIENYCNELKDVNIEEITHVDLESLNFLDYFVNSIFVDWAVQDNINDAIQKIEQLKVQINRNIKILQDKKAENITEVADLRNQIEELIVVTD